MSDSDLSPLLESAGPRWRRRSTLICLALLGVGLACLATAITLSYFLLVNKDVVGLRVMALNTWGMPATFGSQDKELRMQAIGEHIARGEHDLYLLSELWMRPDHNTIKSLLPANWTQGGTTGTWHMTTVGDLASSCDGTIGPDGCSGLAIVSRFPFIEKEFTGFTDHGDAWWLDGEYLARKGVGRVRVEPAPGHTVDAFVTHTAASDYNHWYRQRQVKELVKVVSRSDADFIILGGDFNADPKANANETTLADINRIMKNSIEEYFHRIENWLTPQKATYANPDNTYSSQFSPVMYDFIFHRKNGENMIWANFFDIPFLKGLRGDKSEDKFSFSDHEAVTAKLYLWKPQPRPVEDGVET